MAGSLVCSADDCDREIPPRPTSRTTGRPARGRPAEYCSLTCRNRAKRHRTEAEQAAATAALGAPPRPPRKRTHARPRLDEAGVPHCIVCDGVVERRQGKPGGKYGVGRPAATCSPACSRRHETAVNRARRDALRAATTELDPATALERVRADVEAPDPGELPAAGVAAARARFPSLSAEWTPAMIDRAERPMLELLALAFVTLHEAGYPLER